MAPAVNKEALEGLKFSECLPRELGLAILATRMQDVSGIREILSQPMRVVSGA
jgi:ATP-dependent Lhr-like helicase